MIDEDLIFNQMIITDMQYKCYRLDSARVCRIYHTYLGWWVKCIHVYLNQIETKMFRYDRNLINFIIVLFLKVQHYIINIKESHLVFFHICRVFQSLVKRQLQ